MYSVNMFDIGIMEKFDKKSIFIPKRQKNNNFIVNYIFPFGVWTKPCGPSAFEFLIKVVTFRDPRAGQIPYNLTMPPVFWVHYQTTAM